ncbi:MAG: hypothetical protein HY313_10495 [Acidobacteria bacterium]|nr:hypothetical protein [Acidobacteriota bacterium]
MQRFVSLSLFLLLSPILAQAQEGQTPQFMANATFAPSAVISSGEATSTFYFGGGGEGLIYKGLGAGADIGYLFPKSDFKEGVGLLSTNGYYHFFTEGSSQKLVPFATAGYSLGFREGTANLVNFGGGVDYWFHEKAALRLEVRDNVWPGECRCDPSVHFLMFRVGVVGR